MKGSSRLLVLLVPLGLLAACDGGPTQRVPDGSAYDLPSLDSGAAVDAAPIRPFSGCPGIATEVGVIDEVAPPATMKGGAKASVSVTLANCGTETWQPAPIDLAEKGFKLGNPHETPPFGQPLPKTWGLSRVALPGPVPPNHSVTFAFEITAPAVTGTYPYAWQILSEWVRWLEAPTPTRQIKVNGVSSQFDLHPRSDWVNASQPVTGPSMDVLALRYIVIHYNGGNADLDGPDNVYQDADFVAHLQQSHAYYLSDRGYSYGYNSVIAPDGDEWLVRGMTYRSAANGCTKVNIPGYAIQLALPSVTAQPTAIQIAGIKAAVARVRAWAKSKGNNNTLVLRGHRDVRPECGNGGTGCPGDALQALMTSGAFGTP